MTRASPVVLVVDDEAQIRRFLRAGLELDGFAVQDAETGADALRCATREPPDLVILDLGLPDMDGAEVLERLRAWSSVPLIVLSVRSNEAEKVRLLESGADDYVVKPFGMAELLARAHAAMRRHVRVASGEPVVKVGPLTIDLTARIVTRDGARVMLTPKEYRVLQLLAQHAGNVVTHQFLLKEHSGDRGNQQRPGCGGRRGSPAGRRGARRCRRHARSPGCGACAQRCTNAFRDRRSGCIAPSPTCRTAARSRPRWMTGQATSG